MEKRLLLQLHDTEKEMLIALDKLCEKHGLQYYLIGGTLLGAVRHKGFIPWDDDLDVAMPRKDFEKFIRMNSKELGDGLFIQSYLTDKHYPLMFAKIRKDKTIFLEETGKDTEMHHGIFIDIFPLDYRDDNDNFFVKKKFVLAKKIDHLLKIREYNLQVKKKNYFLFYLFKGIPSTKLSKIRDFLLCSVGNDKSPYYVNHGSQRGIAKQTILREWYNNPIRLEFEKDYFWAPKEYDKILKRIFGEDYMELPSEEKRETHNPLCLCFNTDDEKG